eukprot:scaffold2098_cov235-Pinguiococcus_pyrenoidosus.AAC.4
MRLACLFDLVAPRNRRKLGDRFGPRQTRSKADSRTLRRTAREARRSGASGLRRRPSVAKAIRVCGIQSQRLGHRHSKRRRLRWMGKPIPARRHRRFVRVDQILHRRVEHLLPRGIGFSRIHRRSAALRAVGGGFLLFLFTSFRVQLVLVFFFVVEDSTPRRWQSAAPWTDSRIARQRHHRGGEDAVHVHLQLHRIEVRHLKPQATTDRGRQSREHPHRDALPIVGKDLPRASFLPVGRALLVVVRQDLDLEGEGHAAGVVDVEVPVLHAGEEDAAEVQERPV